MLLFLALLVHVIWVKDGDYGIQPASFKGHSDGSSSLR